MASQTVLNLTYESCDSDDDNTPIRITSLPDAEDLNPSSPPPLHEMARLAENRRSLAIISGLNPDDVNFDDSDASIVEGGAQGQSAPSDFNEEEESSINEPASSPSIERNLSNFDSSDEEDEGATGGRSKRTVLARKSFSLRRGPDASPENIASEYRDVLRKRGLPFAWQAPRNQRSRQLSPRKADGVEEWSLENAWSQYLSALPVDFFSSDEAVLKADIAKGTGTCFYEPLLIHESNNQDLEWVYTEFYERQNKYGSRVKAYEKFVSAAGCFARMGIALGEKDGGFIQEFHKAGCLFELVIDAKLVEAFVSFYGMHGSASTAYGRALYLGELAKAAEEYYGRKKDDRGASLARASKVILDKEASIHRRIRRVDARRNKSIEAKAKAGEILVPKDFERCSTLAVRQLTDIAKYLKKAYRARKDEGVLQAVKDRPGIIEKWCIHFISLLILQCGGQRPQVFFQLQLPTSSELRSCGDMAARCGFFELRTVVEKVGRSLDCPHVVVPRRCLKYLEFHVDVIRPCIVSLLKLKESRGRKKTLLLHTKRGVPLTTPQVTATLKRFLKGVDPELGKITTRSVRGSYATMMLRAFRNGMILADRTEEQFLSLLAKMMNCTPEILASSYASNCSADFRSAAAEMAAALANPGGGGEDEHNNLGEDYGSDVENMMNSMFTRE